MKPTVVKQCGACEKWIACDEWPTTTCECGAEYDLQGRYCPEEE